VELPGTWQKSRFDATDSAGRVLGVFLPRGSVVRGGDVLVAEDGSLIRVVAAPSRCWWCATAPSTAAALDLMRAAYHLGNRHVPLEVQADRLQFEPDHVLADMLRAMHLIVSDETAPFEPEAGAYAAGFGPCAWARPPHATAMTTMTTVTTTAMNTRPQPHRPVASP
jgi:urease accessory protein